MTSTNPPAKKPRARYVRPSEWKEHRTRIEQLYVEQGKPLEKVMAVMKREQEFDAQKSQYKAQIAKWGFSKYAKRNKDRAEETLSHSPTERQKQYWVSREYLIIGSYDLCPGRMLQSAKLVSLATEMLQADSYDLLEFAQAKLLSGSSIQSSLLQDGSVESKILSLCGFAHGTWKNVFCAVAVPKSLIGHQYRSPRSCPNPSRHSCCPKPTEWERRYQPQCEYLLKMSITVLLMGIQMAHVFFRPNKQPSSRQYQCQIALNRIEQTFPSAMSHVRKYVPDRESIVDKLQGIDSSGWELDLEIALHKLSFS